MTTAEEYNRELKRFRAENPQPGTERDEELAEIIDRYHRKSVRRHDTSDSSIQWYEDQSFTRT